MKKHLTIFYFLTFLIMVISSIDVRAGACAKHLWGNWKEEWAATCIRDGSRYHECQICNTIERESVPATGNHTWEEWYEVFKPTCVENGTKRRQCEKCYIQETEPIPAIGHHTWGKWYKIYEPTCEYTGIKERTCATCHKTEEKEIPKTQNHSWRKWVVTKKATALSNGRKTRLCSECYKKEKKLIPKLKAEISLKKKSVTIESGKSYTIKIKSKTYGDKVKKWKSSNRKIAIVNSNGKVTGKQKGIATITLEMQSKVRATCKIKVIKPKQVTNPKTVVTPNPLPAQPSSVWLSATGEKYHRIPNCGKMNPATARQVSLSEAVGQGYAPCTKCF